MHTCAFSFSKPLTCSLCPLSRSSRCLVSVSLSSHLPRDPTPPPNRLSIVCTVKKEAEGKMLVKGKKEARGGSGGGGGGGGGGNGRGEVDDYSLEEAGSTGFAKLLVFCLPSSIGVPRLYQPSSSRVLLVSLGSTGIATDRRIFKVRSTLAMTQLLSLSLSFCPLVAIVLVRNAPTLTMFSAQTKETIGTVLCLSTTGLIGVSAS